MVAAAAAYLIHDGTSPQTRALTQGTMLAAATNQHQFLSPECAPLGGRRWVYPGPVKINSTQYESFAISYSCQTAAEWTKRMIQDVVPFSKTGNPITIHGPSGFYCSAWADATGHAYAGGCQKGAVAFGWNWNVVNPHDYFARDANGRMRLSKASGADAETVLRTRSRDHYELDVENTSGIGFINRFTWSPPPGWMITEITKTSGGKCSLASGTISCSGMVQPPGCLCAGGGGDVAIDFTVAATRRPTSRAHPISYGSVGAIVQLKAMTAVPFLIPGTPQAAARRRHGQ